MTEYLPQLLLAWSIQWMGVLSPGPSVALILGVATRQGRLASMITAFGIACGSIVLSLATVLGIAVIFAQVAEIMTVVRFAGAAYLLWLGWCAFRKAVHPPELTFEAGSRGSAIRVGLSGFLLQISNPKAIMFWLAIASLGGAGEAPWPVIAFFVAGTFINSFAGHGGYAWLLSSALVRSAYARGQRWIEGALGCFFVFASYKLATQRL